MNYVGVALCVCRWGPWYSLNLLIEPRLSLYSIPALWSHWVLLRYSETCLSRTLSKPKTYLKQTDFTVPSTKSGADPGFQVREGAFKKIAPSGGRLENVGGISCEKSRFDAKKSYFFQFQGGGHTPGAPTPGSAPVNVSAIWTWVSQNAYLNWTNSSVPKGFGLDRFYCTLYYWTSFQLPTYNSENCTEELNQLKFGWLIDV